MLTSTSVEAGYGSKAENDQVRLRSFKVGESIRRKGVEK
jgi:hypothetical protein